jgi:hypothetical protein
MTRELRAEIRRMINENQAGQYVTLTDKVVELLNALDRDEPGNPESVAAWLDLVRPGPSTKVEFEDEHVPGEAYVLSYPGAKDGIMWQADCSCGQYHTAPYATPEIAREVAKNHAEAKNND